MRIVLAVKYIHDRMGGAERMVCLTANALAELGHEVFITTFEGGSPQPKYEIDSRVTVVDCKGAPTNPIVTQSCAALASQLELSDDGRGWIKRNADFSASWSSGILKLKPDCVIGFMPHSYAPLLWGLGTMVPVLVSMQNHPRLEFARFQESPSEDYAAIYRSLLNRARKVVVLLPPYEQEAAKFCDSTVVTLSNFSDIEPKRRRRTQRPYLIAAGRFAPVKGFEFAIEAMQVVRERIPNALLSLFGDGPLENQYLDDVRSRWLQHNIVIPGPTSRLNRYFAESSLCLMPSFEEGLPLVALEAFKCGVPVIAFDDCDALRILLTDGAGVLVQKRCPIAYGEAIADALVDKEKLRNLGHGAEQASEKYSRDAFVSSLRQAVAI